jgi:hypothetical protein
MYVHVYIYIHIYRERERGAAHVCVCVYMYTHKHTYIQASTTQKLIHRHTHIPTNTHTHTHKHTHTHIYTFTKRHTYTYMHTYRRDTSVHHAKSDSISSACNQNNCRHFFPRFQASLRAKKKFFLCLCTHTDIHIHILTDKGASGQNEATRPIYSHLCTYICMYMHVYA